MKIALKCQSPLLESSLMMFLRDYIVCEEECNFIISDEPIDGHKAVCLIRDGEDSHIRKPFTKESLLEDLHQFYQSIMLNPPLQNKIEASSAQESLKDFVPLMSPPNYPRNEHTQDLQEQIQKLAQEFAQKVVTLVQNASNK